MPDTTPDAGRTAGGTRIARAQTEGDRAAVFRFRYGLYVDGMKKRIAAADHARRMLEEPLDATGRIYTAEAGGEICGTLRVNHAAEFTQAHPLPQGLVDMHALGPFLETWPEALTFTSRLMVALTRRGSAMLHRLIGRAYADALADGRAFDFCYAPPYLVEMYLQLGYRLYTKSKTDPSVGYLVPLVLPLRDWDHLADVNSPLLRVATRAGATEGPRDDAVVWFHEHYGPALESFDGRYDADRAWAQLSHAMHALSDNSPGVFSGFTGDEVQRVLRSNAVLRCPAGDRVVQRGDSRDEMFVVLSGRVVVRLEADGPPITELGPGQVFGEMSMLNRAPRSAYVDVVEDCEILTYTRQALDRLMKVEPELAARLLLNLANILGTRLTSTNDHLRGTGDSA
ncbi:Crp/Fnr family transcriptional regulator [Caenispirillum salinarum]|uniref:Crp/Fnr family transcriptional regulator n=1 Tax=Caenispirillum salinarum TaxID=859058 RepID=UPI00384A6058